MRVFLGLSALGFAAMGASASSADAGGSTGAKVCRVMKPPKLLHGTVRLLLAMGVCSASVLPSSAWKGVAEHGRGRGDASMCVS